MVFARFWGQNTYLGLLPLQTCLGYVPEILTHLQWYVL